MRTANTAAILYAILLGSCATSPVSRSIAQEPASGGSPEKTADEIARELSNPTAALATISTNLIYREFEGDLPGSSKQDTTQVLFRPAIPILFNQPVFDAGAGGFDDEDLSLGDTGFDLACGTTTPGGTLLLAGLVGTIPTASDDALGKDQWALGPEFLIGLIPDRAHS